MEVPKKGFNDHERKKFLVKTGGGGGGIGAVILLGGALATAALASSFIVGKKGRNSGNQPSKQKNKQDEANKGLDKCSDVHKLPRGTTKPKKVGFSDQSLALDEKPRMEINGGTPTDVEETDEKLPLEPKNLMHREKNELTEEGIINEISKEGEDFQKVYTDNKMIDRKQNGVMNHKEAVEISEIQTKTDENIEEEIVLTVVDKAIEEMVNNLVGNGDHIDVYKMEAEKNIEKEVDHGDDTGDHVDQMEVENNLDLEVKHGDSEVDIEQVESEKNQETEVSNGETIEVKSDAIEKNKFDVSLSEAIASDSDSPDGQGNPVEDKNVENDKEEEEIENIVSESLLAGTPVGEQENGNGEVAEIIKEYVEVQVVEEEKESNRTGKDILPEKCEANQNSLLTEEKMLKQELISSESSEVKKADDVVNGEVGDSSEIDNATVGDLIIGQREKEDNIKDDDDYDYDDNETDLSDEVEESSIGTQDSSPQSNSEAIWPAESLEEPTVELQQIKLVDQELTGKIGEDKAIKQVKSASEDNFQDNTENSITVESLKNTIKNVVERTLLKDHLKSTNVRRMLIVMISILSSLSCSWLFDCSFVKLCIIMFFTIILSEIHGY